jgi:glycerophosphoryl diester phosphodiesterase
VLLVAHDLAQSSSERTLQSLYLDPLFQRFLAHKGRIYDASGEFTLLIDIKSAEGPTYQALRALLVSYANRPNGQGFLTRTVRGVTEPGAVTTIVSGGVVAADVEAEWERYVGIDGRSTDLDSTRPASVMPLISERWGQLFTWDGRGAMPAAERAKLKAFVDAAHLKGRRVRFWATPERPAVWQELLGAGVDLINTDDLARLAAFLRARPLPVP